MKISSQKIMSTLIYIGFFTYLGASLVTSYVISDTVNDANASCTIELNLTAPEQGIHDQKVLFPAWVFPLFVLKPYFIGFFTGAFMVITHNKGD